MVHTPSDATDTTIEDTRGTDLPIEEFIEKLQGVDRAGIVVYITAISAGRLTEEQEKAVDARIDALNALEDAVLLSIQEKGIDERRLQDVVGSLVGEQD